MADRFWIFLLLGSYDDHTLKVLNKLKGHISENLMHESDYILVFLLDTLRIYQAEIIDAGGERQKITLVGEQIAGKVSLITLIASQIVDAIDITLKQSSDVDKLIRDYIERKYKIMSFRKLGILEKLKELASTTSMTFVIRDQELTRGGEYIELAYLLGLQPSKGHDFFVFKKEGFHLSEMAWELLSEYNVSYRSYVNEEALFNEASRIAKGFIQRKTVN